MEQKASEGGDCLTKVTYSSRVKSHLKIIDEQQSVEEIFAEAGNYTVHSDILQRLVI